MTAWERMSILLPEHWTKDPGGTTATLINAFHEALIRPLEYRVAALERETLKCGQGRSAYDRAMSAAIDRERKKRA